MSHYNVIKKFIFVKFFFLLAQQQSKMFLYENLGKQQNLFFLKYCHFLLSRFLRTFRIADFKN